MGRYELQKHKQSRHIAESRNRFTSPTDKYLNKITSEYLWSDQIFAILSGHEVPKDVQIIEKRPDFTVIRSDQPLGTKLYVVKNQETGALGYYTGKVILTGDSVTIENFLSSHSLAWEKLISTYIINVENIQKGIDLKSEAEQTNNIQIDLDINFSRALAK